LPALCSPARPAADGARSLTTRQTLWACARRWVATAIPSLIRVDCGFAESCRVLQEVKIPPGPRLQILNHVDAIKAYRAKYGKKQMPAACLSLALPVRGQPAW